MGALMSKVVSEVFDKNKDGVTREQLKAYFEDNQELKHLDTIALALGHKHLKKQGLLPLLDQNKVSQLEKYLIKLSNEQEKCNI